MTDQLGPCAGCKYWQVVAYEGWKPPEYDPHDKPTLRHWKRHVEKKWGGKNVVLWRNLKGDCLLNPTPLTTRGGGGCGQFSDSYDTSADQRLDDFFEISPRAYWIETNDHLREQLKRSRKISASRLERLKKLPQEPD